MLTPRREKRPDRVFHPTLNGLSVLEARRLLSAFTGSTGGYFDNPQPADAPNTGSGTADFTWGTGYNSPPNSFQFSGASFDADQEQVFSLGNINYFNGTTIGALVTTVDLEVPISLTSPAGTSSQTFTYPLNMVSTPNTGDVLGDRDYVYLQLPSTPYETFTTANGDTVTLQILGFGTVAGQGGVGTTPTTLNEFLVEEGASASAQLLARFVNPANQLPDIAVTAVSTSQDQQNVNVNYTITGQDLPMASTIGYYWATGQDFADRLETTPVATVATSTASSPDTYSTSEPISQLGTQPTDAKYILAVADSPDLANGNPGGLIPESNEGNNIGSVAAPPLPDSDFKIDYTNLDSFIATDTITLHATTGMMGSDAAGLHVKWTVEGEGAAFGIDGFPTDYDTTTDITGGTSFSFTPSDDPMFVQNRHTQWTQGSYIANQPIGFAITATITYATGYQAVTSKTIYQDEIDTVREEYYDYQTPGSTASIPSRYDFVPSITIGVQQYNWGNYDVQLNNDLPGLFNAVLAKYQGMPVSVTIGGQQYATNIPNTALITINSGYRDPQHNKAIGSHVPFSQHTLGSALDLKPQGVTVAVLVNGHSMRVALPVDQVLFPALLKAAQMVGSFAQAEANHGRVPVGTPGEDHIHVQR